MPAQSEAQRRAAGMALAYQRGKSTTTPGPAVKHMAEMKPEQLRDFAKKPIRRSMRYHRRRTG